MSNHGALEQAIRLTDEILVLLEEQDLSRLDALEVERQSFMGQAFSQPVEQIDRIKSMYLLSLNQEVVEKLIVLKLSIRQKQQVASNASKATRAYRNHQ
mgnify:FL=1|jgi:hypothetical protein